MDFNEYQQKSRETAIYPNKGDNLPYLALGISGEAGEVSEKVKKFRNEASRLRRVTCSGISHRLQPNSV